MTKLQEWMSGLGIIFAIWMYLITSRSHNDFVQKHYDLILYSPVICAFMFGLYALSVVLYRVYTFNDCEQAAVELAEEIQEAKENLAKLGFKFKETAK
nr:unnamed protein product [Callosobruchus chinensis]